MAAHRRTELIEALVDTRKIFSLACVSEIQRTGVGELIPHRALIRLAWRTRHERVVSAPHPQTAIVQEIERILNPPIENVNRLPGNLGKRRGEVEHRIAERSLGAVAFELHEVLIHHQ